jgi:LCP family protein required for cell wall assembly
MMITLTYFFLPVRTNILLLGIDYADFESYVARSDTIILTTIVPLKPYVGMLSIPRDLWVTIPGFGENRINTAHFYAEAQQPGSGPIKLIETIDLNFGIKPEYYARIRFDGFREIVDALDGIEIYLPRPMAGYPAGTHHLTGNKALAFVRNREWSDDFSRMEQAQFMLSTLMRNMLRPGSWQNTPAVYRAVRDSIDTNVPLWFWPRLILAVFRAGPQGIDNHVISRQMVTPFVTSGGAYVLAPNWQMINNLLEEMFSK